MQNIINISNFDLYYGTHHALRNINLSIEANKVTALIGPSGCGKSTLLKSINRMNDLIPAVKTKGSINIMNEDIYHDNVSVEELRKNVGLVFQHPTPFPKSIYENIVYGPKLFGIKDKKTLDETVKSSLQQAALWKEVKDKLNKPATSLSGGQQQRLCIARALAVNPQILLMDEPTSALDPISTAKIEDLLLELKKDYTILIVTHNMQQAMRIADKTAFFLDGDLVEYNDTNMIFNNPKSNLTKDYVLGKFG